MEGSLCWKKRLRGYRWEERGVKRARVGEVGESG